MCHVYIAPINRGAVGSNYLRVILSMMNIEQAGEERVWKSAEEWKVPVHRRRIGPSIWVLGIGAYYRERIQG